VSVISIAHDVLFVLSIDQLIAVFPVNIMLGAVKSTFIIPALLREPVFPK
jgi:hypothetical protein